MIYDYNETNRKLHDYFHFYGTMILPFTKPVMSVGLPGYSFKDTFVC